MIIKLNESTVHNDDISVDTLSPETNEVEIYWSEDGVEDKTFIFKQVFRKTLDHESTGAWYAVSSQELVGWHAGSADINDTERFIGNLGGHPCSETDWPYSKEEFNRALTKEYYGTEFIKIIEK